MEIPLTVPDILSRLKSKIDPANLRLRIVSAFVLAPLVLVCIYFGGWLYAVVTILFMALAMHEWLKVVSPSASPGVIITAHSVLLATFGLGFVVWLLGSASVFDFLGASHARMATRIIICLLFELLLFAVLYGVAVSDKKKTAGWVLMGLLYIGIGGIALLWARFMGMKHAYFLFLTVWVTDIGAYLAGQLIGGPRLAPEISPKKTWAGLFGGMAFAALFGYGVATGFGSTQTWGAVKLALVLAVVAQLGDLFESYVKRQMSVKDSGRLIPGHGGVLDRIDGLLFAAVFFVLLYLIGV